MFKLVVRDDLSLANYSSQPELQLECSHSGNILTLCLKAYDVSAQIYYLTINSAVLYYSYIPYIHQDIVLLGDLVRSIAVLQYSSGSLIEIARDHNANYMRY